MKRSKFIGLLGVTATSAVAFEPTPVELAEDAEICRVAKDLLQNYASGNFDALVQAMHPSAQKLAYNSISTRFEKLAEQFGESQLLVVSGLSGHPKTLGLTPQPFLVHLLQLALAKYPSFNALPPKASLKIIGGVVDPQPSRTYAHVLYAYRTSVKSTASETTFSQPRQLALVQHQNHWLCWSAFGTEVCGHWHAALIANETGAKKGEG